MQNMTFYGRSLLFLGAHPDDIELGCGAFISDMAGKAAIHCMTFSDNQKILNFCILLANTTIACINLG